MLLVLKINSASTCLEVSDISSSNCILNNT